MSCFNTRKLPPANEQGVIAVSHKEGSERLNQENGDRGLKNTS